MPFARIDLAKGKTAEYRSTLADIVYKGIVDVLKAPEGDRFIVIIGMPIWRGGNSIFVNRES